MSEDKQKKERSFFQSVRNYYLEYCNNSSIHGFRYLGEQRSYFERGWWLVVFSLTVAGCIVAIHEVYLKWVNSPVIVSFATKETPIYNIPFPAVTICPESKSQQHLYNHSEIVRKLVEDKPLTEEEQTLVDYMGLLCDKTPFINFTDTKYVAEDFYKRIDEIRPQNPLYVCKYMGIQRECADLFKPVLTDEGICYAFNILDRSEIYSDDVYFYSNFSKVDIFTEKKWSNEQGYSKDAGFDPYPRRAALAGARNALEVQLVLSKDDFDINCKSGLQGYRVSLHTPMRIATPSQHYFRVPLNQVVLALVKPDMITTSAAVQNYDPSRRECYFPHERKLKYFKIYTALNCKMECLANYTYHYCGCVNYFMPRENSTNVCGAANLDCMVEAEKELELGDLLQQINEVSKIKKNRTQNLPKCDCMPLCDDMVYNSHTSQSPWQWYDELRTFNSTKVPLEFERDEYHMSKLVVFFQFSQFISSERHELYGPTDFLANFGGLLGLFTGFSMFSIMELIYFLTIRIWCNSRLYGHWDGPNNR